MSPSLNLLRCALVESLAPVIFANVHIRTRWVHLIRFIGYGWIWCRGYLGQIRLARLRDQPLRKDPLTRKHEHRQSNKLCRSFGCCLWSRRWKTWQTDRWSRPIWKAILHILRSPAIKETSKLALDNGHENLIRIIFTETRLAQLTGCQILRVFSNLKARQKGPQSSQKTTSEM